LRWRGGDELRRELDEGDRDEGRLSELVGQDVGARGGGDPWAERSQRLRALLAEAKQQVRCAAGAVGGVAGPAPAPARSPREDGTERRLSKATLGGCSTTASSHGRVSVSGDSSWHDGDDGESTTASPLPSPDKVHEHGFAKWLGSRSALAA